MSLLFSLEQTTAPTEEPLSLSQVKDHLRVLGNDDDVYIQNLIKSTRIQAEERLSRQLMTATWQLNLTGFQEWIQLPRPPFQSITSITYEDQNESDQSLSSDDYEIDSGAVPPWLRILDIPTANEKLKSVRIKYQSGYTSKTNVPEPIKDWMKFQIGYMYENRERYVVGRQVNELKNVDSLLWSYKVHLNDNYITV